MTTRGSAAGSRRTILTRWPRLFSKWRGTRSGLVTPGDSTSIDHASTSTPATTSSRRRKWLNRAASSTESRCRRGGRSARGCSGPCRCEAPRARMAIPRRAAALRPRSGPARPCSRSDDSAGRGGVGLRGRARRGRRTQSRRRTFLHRGHRDQECAEIGRLRCHRDLLCHALRARSRARSATDLIGGLVVSVSPGLRDLRV